jgi:aminopeptidase
MTHRIAIIAEADKYELKGIDPAKLTARVASHKAYREKMDQKELDGKLTRTIGMYGTPAMADDVGMTLEEYRNQIIQACYLDEADPIAKWKQTQEEITHIIQSLNALKIQKVHLEGEDVDLRVTIGSDRQRL